MAMHEYVVALSSLSLDPLGGLVEVDRYGILQSILDGEYLMYKVFAVQVVV